MTRTPESSPIPKGEVPSNPVLDQLPHLSPEEAGLLAKHFEVFSETTNKLVSAHRRLQEQIKVLMEELEIKNQQLQRVNRELARKIEEEEEIREFLDRLIDSMESGLIAVDGNGCPTRMNRYASKLLDWGSNLPARLSDLLEDPHDELLTPRETEDRRSRKGETRLKTRNGKTLSVRYTAVPLEAALRDSETVPGSLIVFEDLSEVRLLEEKVRRANRLAALGELAAGVAHELRNPLATMRGFLQLLPTEYRDPDFREECSTRLIGEIDRLARLTDELLEYSRPIETQKAPADLKQLVEEVIAEQLEALSAAGVEVKGESEMANPIPLDRERMKQVLLNLVINARQAMPQGGRLEWRLDSTKEAWGQDGEEIPFIRLVLSDTGQGIESRHMDSLFDPFFTTKAGGTGLGLAICNRIVEEHGGVIRAESQVGKGTRFSLYFPTPSVSGEDL
jgi:signal transduction histidine kinase